MTLDEFDRMTGVVPPPSAASGGRRVGPGGVEYDYSVAAKAVEPPASHKPSNMDKIRSVAAGAVSSVKAQAQQRPIQKTYQPSSSVTSREVYENSWPAKIVLNGVAPFLAGVVAGPVVLSVFGLTSYATWVTSRLVYFGVIHQVASSIFGANGLPWWLCGKIPKVGDVLNAPIKNIDWGCRVAVFCLSAIIGLQGWSGLRWQNNYVAPGQQSELPPTTIDVDVLRG